MTEKEIHNLKLLLISASSMAYEEPSLFMNTDGTLRRGNEQTIAFRVGIHLNELLKTTRFSELNLDSEYNKYKNLLKLRPNGDGSTMRPDLVIHNRNSDDQNILVVEFAGWWKPKKYVKIDRNKLKEMTNLIFNFKYELGILVRFEKDGIYFEYFQNGEQTEVKKVASSDLLF